MSQTHVSRRSATPTWVQAILDQVQRDIEQNRIDTAAARVDELVAKGPDEPEGQRLLGLISLLRGQAPVAVPQLEHALALQPDNAATQMNLGMALFAIGRTQPALRHLERATELAPHASVVWLNFGNACKNQGEIAAARRAYESALRADPEDTQVHVQLGLALTMLGEFAAAAAHYRKVLARYPDYAQAWFALSQLKTLPLSRDDINCMRHQLARPNVIDDCRVWLGFALAQGLDQQGDYAGAFRAWQEANAIQLRYVSWDIQAAHQRTDGLIRAFSEPLPAPLEPDLGHEIVFIASMPRSGSTLVERILGAHSQVEAANELHDLRDILREESDRRGGRSLSDWASEATAEDWHRLGTTYLARTARWRREKPISTDKGLDNWALVGAISAMLPGARIVNVQRDPLETCFACYRQLFALGVPFSCSLEMLAHYYVDYARATAFWQRRFPQRFYHLHYESLQTEPDTETFRLLDFCALPHQESCLQFHRAEGPVRSLLSAAQVRQPIQRHTARADDYGAMLDPLRRLLAAQGMTSPD